MNRMHTGNPCICDTEIHIICSSMWENIVIKILTTVYYWKSLTFQQLIILNKLSNT